MKLFNTNLIGLSVLAMTASSLAAVQSTQDFVADLNGVCHVVTTEVAGEPALFVSSLAGEVAAYTLQGKLLWKQPERTPAVLFEIRAADINGDGRDELLGASGDGEIHCWGNDGKPLWNFNPGHKVRFSDIAVLKAGRESRIFAGGNDYTLYELNAEGKLVSKTPIKGVVRKIEIGHFLETDRSSIFLMTYAHDKFRWAFMGFIDPHTKTVLRELPYDQSQAKYWDSLMVTDISVAYVDHDRRDDLLFFGDGGDTQTVAARYFALNGEFKKVAEFLGPASDKQRYAHVQGTALLPVRDEVVLQYGGVTYVCDLQGKLRQRTGKKYSGIVHNDFQVVPSTRQLVAAGEVDGGNGIHLYSLDSPEWLQAEHPLIGRMVEVRNNLDRLYQQTLSFKPPTYQQPAGKPWVMITSAKPPKEFQQLQGGNVEFVQQYAWTESTDRSELVAAIGPTALKRDKRPKYADTRDTIVARARELETKGIAFTVWAGHGNDPFYLHIDTLVAILAVAPKTCYGFVYAEMDNTEDPRVRYFVNEYIPRLAAACRVNNRAKLYFRYKNMFWAATSHEHLWKDLFFSGKYADILVPAAEDTSSRTQDLNFVGRVGMFASGYVNDFAMRLVDDNPTSWRPLSPGGQRSVSPYLRNGALMAAYGARYGVNIENSFTEEPGLMILYALMKSGALPLVEKDGIASIGSWLLIQDVDTELVRIVDSHHDMLQFTSDDENAVFSVAQMDWAGASLPSHDFSKLSLGLSYRWLNYLPELPFGMIPVAPVEFGIDLRQKGTPFAVTDVKAGLVNGHKMPAPEFGKVLASTAQAGALKLPVLVTGAAWSAIRLDAKHIRLVLVDPGYLDPQERTVTIHLQGKVATKARDILSNEALSIVDRVITLSVPAGSLRLVDLSYE